MKKKLLLLQIAGLMTYLVICAYSTGPAITGGVDGTGATNSGGCYQSGCHGYAASTTVSIELDSAGIPVTQYVGGGSYTIKISGSNTSSSLTLPYFGFQLAAVNLSGAGTSSATNAGTLASTGLPASCRYVSALTSGLPIDVVEHDAPIIATSGTGGSGTTYVESIGWTAPAAGTGTVMLYGAINAVNHDGTIIGDAWDTSSAAITEYTPPATVPITGTFTVCTGSTTDLSSTYTTGTWSSASPLVATVSPSGVVTGISAGTAVISYVEGSVGTATAAVTVTAVPVAGTLTATSSSFCAGTDIVYSDTLATGGGVWSSSNTSVASIAVSHADSIFLYGVSAGVDTVYYNVTNACGSASVAGTVTVNPVANPGTILAFSSTVCTSSLDTFVDFAGGGTWSSQNANATVSTGGIVTGVSAGIDTILYSVTNSCGTRSAKKGITIVAPGAGTISGSSSLCAGATTPLSDATSGGTWSSSNSSVATVNRTSGLVYGVALGEDTITYQVVNACGTYTTSFTIDVNSSASAGTVAGASAVCIGSSTLLTDTTGTGTGTWTSVNSTATVSAGMVTGVSAGVDTIIYRVSGTCGTASTTYTIAVSEPPYAGGITGASAVCQGSRTILADTVAGGTWSSSAVGIASVSTSGTVSGISGGLATIYYTISTGCGTVSASFDITVNGLPDAGAISGATLLCAGALDSLTETVTGGTWSETGTSVTIDSSGVVTALAGSGGVDTIHYSATNSCGSSSAAFAIAVVPATAGTITGDTALCIGTPVLLADSIAGGAWTVATGAAEISSGIIVGVAPGTDTIYYSISTICGVSTSSFVVTIDSCWPAGINNIQAATLRLYPNPTEGIVTITLPQANGDIMITVTDLMGKEVVRRDLGAVQSAEADFSMLPAGNYIIIVTQGADIYRRKITIWK